MENDFSKLIYEHINDKKMAATERFEKNAEKNRKKITGPDELALLESELKEKRLDLDEKYDPGKWLTDLAGKAKYRKRVTHASKYTNPYTTGSSLYAPGGEKKPEWMEDDTLISTASLKCPKIDFVGNAADAKASSFLQLSINGVTLIEFIQKNDSTPLAPFAANEDQLDEWMTGFRSVLSAGVPISHTFSKQIYFPVGDRQYHLLSPLKSSSLFQAVYDRIRNEYLYSETSKSARDAKRNGKFSENMVVNFPGALVQTFGGTKPLNISQLNAERNGEAILLICAPPSWEKQKKPPIKAKNIFSKHYFGYRAKKEISGLRNFLESQANDDSSNVRIRGKRGAMIDQIIDHLMQYGAAIQNLQEHAGWSANPECKLESAQKLWLDPHRARMDEAFKHEREKNDWQTEVADQFARWFNKQIGESKKLTPGDREHEIWRGQVKDKFKMFKQDFKEFA